MTTIRPNKLASPKSTDPKAVREAANFYATEMEWPVIPIFGIKNGICACSKGAKCTRPGKHPAIKDWPNAATTDLVTIKSWFKPGKCRNVGIATGKVSGLTVFDVDRRNGGVESFNALRAIASTRQTMANVTGGGFHVFFEYDADFKTSQGKLGPGIDVRADGGLVVMPPSCHSSGKQYRPLKGRGAGEILLARIPKGWLRKSAAMPVRPAANSVANIADGRRNVALTSTAGKLVNTGISHDAVEAALLAENQAACSPPLEDEEVRKVAESARGFTVRVGDGDPAGAFMVHVLDKYYAGGDHLVYCSDGKYWAYGGTHWSVVSTSVLKHVIHEEFVSSGARVGIPTSTFINQVVTLMGSKVAATEDVLRFNADPHQVINFLNGELWLASDGSTEFKPHDAKSYLRHVINANYDPNAQCPLYEKTIGEIFSKASDPEAVTDFWHDLCGYALQPSRRIAAIVVCQGGGGNGKTKLMETLVRAVGQDSVIAMPVQDLDKSRFVSASMFGKYILLDDDVKAGTRLADGALKRLSEQKTMTGEHKFGPPFTFTSRVLPVLLCNNPPSLADLSYGMQRRLIVIPFERSFRDRAADTGLFERIWNSEMSGIVNLYLQGLSRVAARGWQFDIPDAVKVSTKKFIRSANPLPDFLATKCIKDSGKSFQVKALYDAFVAWCSSNGISYAQQLASFKRNLESLGYTVKRKNVGDTVFGLTLDMGGSVSR